MKTIFDVGMHKGEDTEFYLAKGFRVIAIEAVAEFCEDNSRRLADAVSQGTLVVVNAAIADAEGPVTFFRNETNSVWGTTQVDWAERNSRLGAPSREIVVRGTTLSALLEEYGVPYYCKIDVEGADLTCLRSLESATERPPLVSIESSKTSWSALLAEFDMLERLGYSRFKVVNQATVASMRAPVPAREGATIQYAFREGSSGPFGDDLPGPWLSRREALRAYRRIFLRYRLAGDDGILKRYWLTRRVLDLVGWSDNVWFDTHASQ